MKPAPFEYHSPSTLQEALELLEELPDAKLMAGNQSLGIIMSNRLATPGHIVDLNGIDDLRYIDVGDGAIEIGAMTRHATVEHSEELAEVCSLLPESVEHIAGPTVRNQGTLGGSVGEADPAGNYGCVLLALDADLELASTDGRRWVPVEDFFIAYMLTEMDDEEIITAARIDRERYPIDRTGMCFKVKKRATQTWPTLGAAAVVRVDDPDADEPVVEEARLAFANAADVPIRTEAAESELESEPLSEGVLEAASDAAYDGVEPQGEMHADETYKRELAAAYTERTIWTAYDRATGGDS